MSERDDLIETPPVVAWIITDKIGFQFVTQSDVTAEAMLRLGHDVVGLVRLSDYASLRAAQVATISRLEAEVEAGKREYNATAARFARLHAIASKIRWTDLGQPAMEVTSTQEGLTELSQFLLQDALEECLDRQGLPRTEGERA